jgi:plastocyanin
MREAGPVKEGTVSKFVRAHARYGVAATIVAAALAGAAVAVLAAHAATRSTRVVVTEREYQIKLSQRSFKPGTFTLVVQNRGKLRHTFEIRGPGIAGKRIAGTIAPGAQRSLTVRLRGGTYNMWCLIHRAQGMKTTIKVAGANTAGTTTSGGTTTGGGGAWG